MSITIFLILICLAISGSIIGIMYAFGFFHDSKPPKPDLGIIQNELIIAEFDKLYDKYPNINQADVNQLHISATNACFLSTHQTVKENHPESDTAFGQMMGNALCSGIISGAIETYLNGLNIPYYASSDGQPPQLIQ